MDHGRGLNEHRFVVARGTRTRCPRIAQRRGNHRRYRPLDVGRGGADPLGCSGCRQRPRARPHRPRDPIFKTATGKANFTVCDIPDYALAPGEYLLTTVRTHDQFNSTIYGLNDRYRGVFGGRRVIFLHPQDMADEGWQAGQLVHIHSHFEGEVRQAQNFIVVPYSIPRRSAAAYYPETNVLVPVRSVALKSNQPAYKCIRITLHASLAEMPRDVRL